MSAAWVNWSEVLAVVAFRDGSGKVHYRITFRGGQEIYLDAAQAAAALPGEIVQPATEAATKIATASSPIMKRSATPPTSMSAACRSTLSARISATVPFWRKIRNVFTSAIWRREARVVNIVLNDGRFVAATLPRDSILVITEQHLEGAR